jgi:aldehyde:ferredoxin oxidoreductase
MTDELPPAYGGEILHVDLSTDETWREPVDPTDTRRFLGGNGFAANLVRKHVPSDAEPLSPENLLVFAVGPMTATPFQSTSRGVAGFISPMTNGFFDSTFEPVQETSAENSHDVDLI